MSLPGNPLFLSRTSILTGKCWISGINMYVLVYPPPLTKVFPLVSISKLPVPLLIEEQEGI